MFQDEPKPKKPAKKAKPVDMVAPVIVAHAKPSRIQCCNCHAPVGDKHKTQAFFVDDDGERRTWCPACFFNVRARKEPKRWQSIAAVDCGSCGWKSVAFGVSFREILKCPKCGSPKCRIPVAPAVAKELLAGS